MLTVLISLACVLDDDSALLDSAACGESCSYEERLTPPTPTAPAPSFVALATPVAEVTHAATPVAATPEAPAAAAVVAPDTARMDTWLGLHGGLQYFASHRMERGETAFALSRAVGVPLWLLRTLNAGQDLDHLQVGDWISFPVTANNREPAAEWVTEEECGC